MFLKILIANRGEIALRVMRTCREMGIQTVAVFSEIDRTSPHVLFADEAYCIGFAPANESYLLMEKIIEIAQKTGSEAIHPGYGFLSENTEFSKSCEKAGIAFIGPPAEAIQAMGDKTIARQMMKKARVPIIPGLEKPAEDLQSVQDAAKEMQFPVLIKATGGGGGKGMRIVREETELKSAYERAKSEALSAFNDSRIYVEKYLENPRHIEFQILADQHGNILSLGERECSIQRRFQKIIEESPSPVVNPDLREKMARAACEAARACRYVGAGTVEFMLDETGAFYFLEMNTRLQVEHPITELCIGEDIVAWQIAIANGEMLPKHFEQSRGHAIECRIYAEDSNNNFAPSTGEILEMRVPDGYGVRFDGGVVAGDEITPYYDPMLGKLIVWGSSRKQAIGRMVRALSEFQIVGVETSIPLCLGIMRHSDFISGKYSTTFLDHNLDVVLSNLRDDTKERQQLSAVVAAVYREKSKSTFKKETKKNSQSRWELLGRRENLR